MRFFKRAAVGALALLLGAAALLAHTWYFKPLRIDWFYARVFASFALNKPELLSSLRILPPWADFYGRALDDVSPEAQDRAARQLREAHATLLRYDRASLDAEGRLSWDTLEHFLRLQVEGEAWRHHDFPVNQLFGVQSELPNFMMQVHQVGGPGEAEAYIARLRKFPLKFDQLLRDLRLRDAKGIVPPQFVVQKVLVQMRQFVAVPAHEHVLVTSFRTRLDQLPAEVADAATRARWLAEATAAVQQQVYPAYGRLIGHFEALAPRAPEHQGAWALPEGARYYAWCIRQHTGTTMSAEALHALGLAEVARLAAEMERILQAQGLREGSLGQRVQALARQPEQLYPNTAEGRQAMLARYQALIDEAAKKLDSAFGRHPRQRIEVRPVPEFAQATAPAAYYQPGAMDDSRPGVFYVNLRDTTKTPKFAMPTLAYHEGVPGHHFQIALAQEQQALPFFRRILPFTAYAEGWALYAERLAWEMGLEAGPLDSLGRLRDEMMRAVRLVVDTGLHHGRWTRAQAVAYMREHTGMAEADVVAEIERYVVDPGQALAYKTGMLKILALRDKAQQALGPRFDLRQFHDEVLGHGALPLAVLERVVDDWIARRRAG